MHFEEQYCLDRSKEELSVIFCAHSTPVSATTPPYRPHSACPTLRFRAGVPPPCRVSPVQAWDGGEINHKQSSPCIPLPPARYQHRAAPRGLGVWACWSQEGSCAGAALPTTGEGSRGHVSGILGCHFYCPSPSRIGSNHFILLSQNSWKAGCYRVGQRSLTPSSPLSKRFLRHCSVWYPGIAVCW